MRENTQNQDQTINSIGLDVINLYKPYRNTHTVWQRTVVAGQTFEIPNRYHTIQAIGHGDFGIVISVKDRLSVDNTKQFVAIKKRQFDHQIFLKMVIRELKILRLMRHQNIIKVQTIVLPKSREQMSNIYVVLDLMDNDLNTIIKSDTPLTEDHNKYFLYQILRGLKYLHSAKIVHRNLKPRSLLVNLNCDLKITGFEMAKPLTKKKVASCLSGQMATRWYKSPELLLDSSQYTTAVDMWSVGCIFAEIILRRPFLPGIDTRNQFQLITSYFGTEGLENIEQLSEYSKKYLKDLPKEGKQLTQFTNLASPQAIDLLKKFFILDPQKRITAEQALKHPFLADFHCQEDELTCEEVDKLQFEFMDYILTFQQLRDILYQEILLYHNLDFRTQYDAKKQKKQSLIKHILNNSNKNINPYDGNGN